MRNYELFVYSNIKTHKTYCETWGASTKHPDTRHIYTNWSACGKGIVEISHPIDIIQWLMYVVSDITCMPWNLRGYIDDINTMWCEWEQTLRAN